MRSDFSSKSARVSSLRAFFFSSEELRKSGVSFGLSSSNPSGVDKCMGSITERLRCMYVRLYLIPLLCWVASLITTPTAPSSASDTRHAAANNDVTGK